MDMHKSNGILHTMSADLVVDEMDTAFESVLSYAMEASGHVISKEVRDNLADDDFGIPSARKYPLYCPNDKEKTQELLGKAIQFFHFCKPDWKPELAKNIIAAMDKHGIIVKIHPKSQINKFVDVPEKYRATDTLNKYHASKK